MSRGDPVYTAPLGTDNWLLDQHRTKDGQAILPGTGYIELLAEAAAAQGLKSFDIQDLYFSARHACGYGRSARDADHPAPAGPWLCRGAAQRLRLWQARRVGNCTPKPCLTPLTEARPHALDLAALSARCGDVARADKARLKSPQEAHLNFGPRWHVLRKHRDGCGRRACRAGPARRRAW